MIEGRRTSCACTLTTPVAKLTEDEIGKILGLKELCERKQGISIIMSGDFLRSLDKPGLGAFQLLKEGRIIGFAFFYSFVKEEAEAMVFADPDEEWSGSCLALMKATMAECERRGHARLLFMNDRRFPAGAQLLIEMGGKLAFSEHRMEATGGEHLVTAHHIDLIEVGNDDPRLCEVELSCFSNFHSKPDQRRFLAMSEGSAVGKVDVNADGTITELTGLCVIPELRGKGHGKAILREVVEVLRIEGKERIVLDVQTDNDIALELYQKAGFRKVFTLDYYAILLRRIS